MKEGGRKIGAEEDGEEKGMKGETGREGGIEKDWVGGRGRKERRRTEGGIRDEVGREDESIGIREERKKEGKWEGMERNVEESE